MQTEIYETFEEFLAKYGYGGEFRTHNQCLFRGEGSCLYKLLPSSLRPDKIRWMSDIVESKFSVKINNSGNDGGIPNEFPVQPENGRDIFPGNDGGISSEFAVLCEFYDHCNRLGYNIPPMPLIQSNLLKPMLGVPFNIDYWIPDEIFEFTGIAQHYGIPTRLLDWTFDMNIALYFALNDRLYNIKDIENDQYLVLWIFDYKFPRDRIDNSKVNLKIIYPKYNTNPNLTSQKGVFMHLQFLCNDLWSNNSLGFLSYDNLIDQNFSPCGIDPRKVLLSRIMINARECRKIYNYLKFNFYDSSILFPGFYGAAKSMNDAARFNSYDTQEDS